LMITPVHKLAYRLRDARSRYIWNRNPPPVGAYHRDLPYVPGGGKRQSLDIAVPPSGGQFPVLMYLHGGGWWFGDKGSSARISRCFAAGGVLVVNANYRLAPRNRLGGMLDDVAAAVRWARENAAAYGGDPGRLMLAGESAGAHLACLYAAAALDDRLWADLVPGDRARPEPVERLLLFYGVYDLLSVPRYGSKRTTAVLQGLLGDEGGSLEERARLASPSAHVPGGYPPVFLCSGEADEFHGQSVAFARVLA